MIIDINNIIGKRKYKPTIGAGSLIKAMDKAGVDMAVIFCFAPVMDNAAIAEAMKQYPGRFIGLFTANPWQDGAADQLKQALDDGFFGLRLDPVRHGFAFNELDLISPLMDICSDAAVPVWAYGAAEVFSSPILFQEVAETYETVSIIMGHMGYSYEATSAMGVAQRNKNIYLDTTGNMFANIQRVVNRVPIDQILLGTGTPEFGFFEDEINKVKTATKDVQHQNMILGGNAARVFGISK
jgi:predicted TIM-barrel fold metal-dependent hydrolase